MKSFALLFGFASLGLASVMSAADITVDETSDDDGDVHKRVFRFSAKGRLVRCSLCTAPVGKTA